MKRFLIPLFLAMFCIIPKITYDDSWFCYMKYKKYYPWATPRRIQLIYMYGKRYRLEFDKVCALLNEESHGHSNAISSSYARGLMQILGKYHYKGRNYNDLFNDDINISIGTRVLKNYLSIAERRYGKDAYREVYRLYNAGPYSNRKNYKNWDYVDRILRHIRNTRKIKIKINII